MRIQGLTCVAAVDESDIDALRKMSARFRRQSYVLCTGNGSWGGRAGEHRAPDSTVLSLKNAFAKTCEGWRLKLSFRNRYTRNLGDSSTKVFACGKLLEPAWAVYFCTIHGSVKYLNSSPDCPLNCPGNGLSMGLHLRLRFGFDHHPRQRLCPGITHHHPTAAGEVLYRELDGLIHRGDFIQGLLFAHAHVANHLGEDL